MLIEIPEGLEEIVPPYLEKRLEEIDTLTALLEDSEFKEIQKICHNLKGTGTSYGFEELSTLGARMETAAKSGDAENLSQDLQKLCCYLISVELRFAETD